VIDLEIARFCAVECELQRSGELSVYHMLSAYDYALTHQHRSPTDADVRTLGALVEPRHNLADRYRTCNVHIGSSLGADLNDVPYLMHELIEECGLTHPAPWFLEFEKIHPFRDGNGRTGVILFCWLSGTLESPDWPPNYFHDHRRTPGWGAPREERSDGEEEQAP